jgi:hypothetical protein
MGRQIGSFSLAIAVASSQHWPSGSSTSSAGRFSTATPVVSSTEVCHNEDPLTHNYIN